MQGGFHLTLQSGNTGEVAATRTLYAGRTSARDLELALEEVAGAGAVSVRRQALADGSPGGAGFGYAYYVTFVSRRGDVPEISAVAGSE